MSDEEDKGSDSDEFIEELDPEREPCPKPIEEDYNIGNGEEHERKRRLPPGYDLKNELFGHHKICGWIPLKDVESGQLGCGSATSLQTDNLSAKVGKLYELEHSHQNKRSIDKVVRFVKRNWKPRQH